MTPHLDTPTIAILILLMFVAIALGWLTSPAAMWSILILALILSVCLTLL